MLAGWSPLRVATLVSPVISTLPRGEGGGKIGGLYSEDWSGPEFPPSTGNQS